MNPETDRRMGDGGDRWMDGWMLGWMVGGIHIYLQSWCLDCEQQWTFDLCLSKDEGCGNMSTRSLKQLSDQF